MKFILYFFCISSFLISCTKDVSPGSNNRQIEKDIVYYCEVILDMSKTERLNFLSSREGGLFKGKYEEEGYIYDERDVQTFCKDKTDETNSYRRSSSRRSSGRSSSGGGSGSSSGSDPGSSTGPTTQESATSIYDEWIKTYDHHDPPLRECGSVYRTNPILQIILPSVINTCSFNGLLYSLEISKCIRKPPNCYDDITIRATSNFPDYFSMDYHGSSKYVYLTIGNTANARTGSYNVSGTISTCGQSASFSFQLVLYPDGQNGCSRFKP